MIQVAERLFVGNDRDCRPDPNRLTVHACKTCHQRGVGYQGSLPKEHPNYLAMERPGELFLNLIDPPVPMFQTESFRIFLDYARRHYDDGDPVLIHCNQGESRAPSLALLFMAKALRTIPDDSYAAARRAFERLYPYKPGKGIETFLTDKWDTIKA